MKKSVIFLAVLMIATFGFVSCENENLDNEKPVVQIVSPVEDEMVRPGNDIHFEVELSDNLALSSYKVNIHGAFDGHDHGDGITLYTRTSVDTDSMKFSKTWLESDFVELGEDPIEDKRNARIQHHHIRIPSTLIRTVNGEQKEMPLKEGHYHFIVYCTDQSGQESFASTEIVISYDADDNHQHYL